ncbi:MAG TPA: bifunctional 4-hydroxy-3-methylbut-2-enyl diphosphate reductase/30S ribosomal protein S1 [Ruminococcaceae bacterium]|nr:bifunctional 4-hydroxy-3-methylbut-2-enyl diphosphate reductase/30S ribosomal protein S1 [Oscillospiraceae bacterium]
MQVILAKTAGFCFGVNRAVNLVYSMLDEGKRVCTLGPLIHNPQVIADFESRGGRIVESPSQALPDETLVIRTHGVSETVEREIESLGLNYCDATCPFVKKIHRIVSEKPSADSVVLIAGNAEHPEVQGIIGHCKENCFAFNTTEELDKLMQFHPEFAQKPIFVVAQTTFSTKEWKICSEKIQKHYTNAIIFDTICCATQERQQEAQALSKQCDAMVIVGGRTSSNTAKLQKVCQGNAPTYLVETADELKGIDWSGCHVLGVTAGASTPAGIIKEVLQTMSENVNEAKAQSEIDALQAEIEQAKAAQEAVGQEASADAKAAVEEAPKKSFDEMTFQEALEESLKSMSTDQKVRGIVVGISPSEIQVDIGRKQTGYVPLSEYSNDPTADPSKELKIGDEIDLIIMKTNDAEGTMMLSKRRFDATKSWDDVCAAKESGEVLEGTVCEVIPNGGVLVSFKGSRVFIPGSHTGLSKDEPLETLLKQKVNFKIIDVNKQRKRAVGSVRAVLRDARKEQAKAFWDNAAEGQTYTGTVKSLTSYGAFVDIGGVDGMVHISELSWKRIKHPSEIVNPGDVVEVFIKKLDTENKKISLGYKKIEDNPWEILRNSYPVGTVTKAKVVGLTDFGAFANVIPGIDGLIHISQIADRRINKPGDVLTVGDEVDVKITDIDFDKKRVSLSIRALIEPVEEAAEEAEAEAETAEVEAEAVEAAAEEAVEETAE